MVFDHKVLGICFLITVALVGGDSGDTIGVIGVGLHHDTLSEEAGATFFSIGGRNSKT
jgi:hypothetical protein